MKNRQQLNDILVAFGAGIDSIDRHEAQIEAVGASVAMVLKTIGFEEVDSFASASMATKLLENEFRKKYWQSDRIGHKISILIATVETAAKIIEEGAIDEGVRHRTAKILAQSKKAGS